MTAPRASANNSKAQRVPELDGLRGVLAWTVVASHILLTSGWFDPLVPRFAILGDVPESAVDVFMLLSGFAITHLLMLRPPTSQYFLRRACRIVPAYFVALVIGMAVNGLLADNLRQMPPGSVAPVYLQIANISASRAWIDAPLHFLFLHGVFPAAVLPALPYTILGVAWSLSLEAQFYVVAPPMFAACRRWRGAIFVLVFVVAATTLFAGRIIAAFSNAFLPAKAAFFLVGALSYFAVQQRNGNRRDLLLCTLPAIALAAFWWRGTGRFYEALLPPIVWVAVIVAVRFDRLTALRRMLNSRPLQWLGLVSYSTYLFHAPVLYALQAVIWRWIKPESSAVLLAWTAALGVPAVALVSALSWHLVEAPFQQLGRRYSSEKRRAL